MSKNVFTQTVNTTCLERGFPMKKHLSWISLALCLGLSAPAFGTYLLVNGFFSSNVLRFDMDTGLFVDEFITSSDGGLSFPEDIIIGPDGNLLISSPSGGIKKYDRDTGDYLGSFASFYGARSMAIGPDDDVFVSREAIGILRFDGWTGAYEGQFTTLPVSSHGMLFHNNYLYATDVYYNKLYRFDALTGNVVDILISGGRLNHPEGILIGDDGLLYIANGYTDEILRYNASTGAFVDVFVAAGSGGLNEPQDMMFGPDGYFYVSGYNSASIHRYDKFTGAFVDTLTSGLPFPTSMLLIPEPAIVLLLGWGGLFIIMRGKTR